MKSELAKRFEEIRTAAGDSPAQAAAKVGISRQGYNKWESGDTENIKLANLLRFCHKYDVAIEPLVRCAAIGMVPPVREYDTTQAATVHQLQEPRPAMGNISALKLVYVPFCSRYFFNASAR
jgi:transcriptional regulator with XRE-family HTH domain